MGEVKLSREEAALCQRALNELVAANLQADGAIGAKTLVAVKQFQKVSGMVQTGVIDETTYYYLKYHIDARFVRQADIVAGARSISVPPSMLLAIDAKESLSSGFLKDKRPVILFERHKFYEFVAKRISKAKADEWKTFAPNICFPVWDSSAYSNSTGEWERLHKARVLDATCALLSASYGRWQIMGFNFSVAGFSDVQSMFSAMHDSEHKQLKAVCGFISSNATLVSAMRSKNFATVARIYNGVGYAKNNYDKELKALEARFQHLN